MEATPAEEVQALKLPEHADAGIVTHHLEAAIRSIEHAEEVGRPLRDRALLAARAETHLLYARRAVQGTLAAWRGYNKRADLLIARLAEEEV